MNINSTNDDYKINEILNWDDFSQLKKNPALLRGIYGYGFEKPSPIQQIGIQPIMEGRDVIAQAQSGTGKTACFGIGALSLVNTDKLINKVQVIILAPTRELSKQIHVVLSSLSCMMKEIKCQLLVGGYPIQEDKRNLEMIKPQIIVGCPGRINDILRRNFLSTSNTKLIVLDEADEMLAPGFKEQVYNIFQSMPNNVQVALFSATIPPEFNGITEKFMQNPVKILVKTEMLTLEGIAQYYVALENDDQKFETLKDIFGSISLSQCIIYCNSVKRVQDLYEAMSNEKFAVCRIHSNMDEIDRTNSYNEFKTGKYRVLISSNVTSRGIDIQQINTVINFDIPNCIHNYLHRIGRSGRWGRKGFGINFVTIKDIKYLREIEKHYQTEIRELPSNWAE